MGKVDNLRWDMRCSICKKMSFLCSQQHSQSVWLGLGANYKICKSKSQMIQYQQDKIMEYLEQGVCKVLHLTENSKHLFKSFLFLSCTLTLRPSGVIFNGGENRNKHFLLPSSYQLGAHNAIKTVPFYWEKGKAAFGKFRSLLLCCLQNILSSWLQALCGIMQRVLRAQKKIAVTLVLGKQLFLQKTFSLYFIHFFSLCVFKRSFFLFRHLRELWISLPVVRMWNQKPDSVLAVWFYIFCTYQTLFKFVRVAPAQHL